MAGLEFADFGNALLAGSSAAYSQGRSRREAEAERMRKEAQQYIEPSLRGDQGAFGKLASADPAAAGSIATMLKGLDATKRAQAKDAAEYTANAANAILQADPATRPMIYRQMREDGVRRGYNLDSLPPEYSPSMDGMLRSQRSMAIPILEQMKLADRPTAVDVPDGGGSRAAISGIESGGRYDAVGPPADSKGSRAYGKYQVMDFNVGPWTQAVLGKAMTPQEFVANPEAQDKVFDAKFGEYTQKYGSPQAAARAWFAGEGGMNNPGAKDVLGTTVAGYEKKFSAGMPAAPGIPGPVAQGDAPPADGSGTPLPPAGQGGQLKLDGGIAQEDPTKYGYKQRGISKGGIVTPQVITGGFFVYRDPRTGAEVLYKPKEESGGPFTGKSTEANALNMLIADGTLTQNQAAQLAAGKTITNPADGSVIFMTPQGLFQRQEGQAPAPMAPGAAAPPAAATPQPGMIPVTPPKPVTMTEGQSNAATYADRMRKSDDIIQKVGSAGLDAKGKLLSAAPGGVGNYLQENNYQLFDQARRDFINAVLRRESGAVISPEEFDNGNKQYFPQPGDSAVVMKQKAENRRTSIEGISRSAGPTYKPPAAVPAAEQPKAPSAAKPPSTPGSLKLPPKIQDGATATNPQTGERIIFKGGQWSPAP